MALRAGSQSLFVRCPPGAGHSTPLREAWPELRPVVAMHTESCPSTLCTGSGLGGRGGGVRGSPPETLESRALQQSPPPLKTGPDARSPGAGKGQQDLPTSLPGAGSSVCSGLPYPLPGVPVTMVHPQQWAQCSPELTVSIRPDAAGKGAPWESPGLSGGRGPAGLEPGGQEVTRSVLPPAGWVRNTPPLHTGC